jgi:hypothetical protein
MKRRLTYDKIIMAIAPNMEVVEANFKVLSLGLWNVDRGTIRSWRCRRMREEVVEADSNELSCIIFSLPPISRSLSPRMKPQILPSRI